MSPLYIVVEEANQSVDGFLTNWIAQRPPYLEKCIPAQTAETSIVILMVPWVETPVLMVASNSTFSLFNFKRLLLKKIFLLVCLRGNHNGIQTGGGLTGFLPMAILEV